jgi:hypothetical protein
LLRDQAPNVKGAIMRGALRAIPHVMFVAVASSSIGVGGADAAFFKDGNKLFDNCEVALDASGKGLEFVGVCEGYILGAFDARADAFCLPAGVNATKLVDVVRLYLREHPEKRYLLAADLVSTAVKQKFPCK